MERSNFFYIDNSKTFEILCLKLEGWGLWYLTKIIQIIALSQKWPHCKGHLFYIDSYRENSSNVSSSETTGPIKGKFHLELQTSLAKCRQIWVFSMPVVFTCKYRQILENTGRLNWPPLNLYNNLHSTFIGVISAILVSWLKDCSNYSPGVNNFPTGGVTCFT